MFSFEVNGDEMSFADHSSKASWRGEFREVARQLGIPDDLTASEFAMAVTVVAAVVSILWVFHQGFVVASLDGGGDRGHEALGLERTVALPIP